MAADADPRHLAARLRYEGLTKAVYAPLQRALVIDFVLLVATTVLALAVASQTGELAPAAVVAWAGSALAGVAAWGWMIDPIRRAAFEVVIDHTVRENNTWQAETGSKLPASLRGARDWLRDHPDAPGRATMLARLGRFDEARVDLRREIPSTPEDALHVEIFLRQLDVFEGERCDTSDLHQRWHSLPDTAARSMRRGCLATLDAYDAANRGHAPWPVLAAARREVGDIDPSARASRYVRTIATLHILFAISVWLSSAFAAG